MKKMMNYIDEDEYEYNELMKMMMKLVVGMMGVVVGYGE